VKPEATSRRLPRRDGRTSTAASSRRSSSGPRASIWRQALMTTSHTPTSTTLQRRATAITGGTGTAGLRVPLVNPILSGSDSQSGADPLARRTGTDLEGAGAAHGQLVDCANRFLVGIGGFDYWDLRRERPDSRPRGPLEPWARNRGAISRNTDHKVIRRQVTSVTTIISSASAACSRCFATELAQHRRPVRKPQTSTSDSEPPPRYDLPGRHPRPRGSATT